MQPPSPTSGGPPAPLTTLLLSGHRSLVGSSFIPGVLATFLWFWIWQNVIFFWWWIPAKIPWFMIIGQRGPDLWELALIYQDKKAIQNYYGCHNSGGSGVILGNLSSLAASHEPPPPPWFPSRGFPNEFLPKLQIQLLYPGYFEQWD